LRKFIFSISGVAPAPARGLERFARGAARAASSSRGIARRRMRARAASRVGGLARASTRAARASTTNRAARADATRATRATRGTTTMATGGRNELSRARDDDDARATREIELATLARDDDDGGGDGGDAPARDRREADAGRAWLGTTAACAFAVATCHLRRAPGP